MDPLLCNRLVSIFKLVILKNQSLNPETFVFRGRCWQLKDRKHGERRGEGGGNILSQRSPAGTELAVLRPCGSCSNLLWLSNYISESGVMQPESSLQHTAALSQSDLLLEVAGGQRGWQGGGGALTSAL